MEKGEREKKYSIIDVGTNNVLLLIAEKNKDSINIIHRDSFTSALGKDMKNGFLTNEALDRTKAILEEIIELSKKYTDKIIIIGTSCSREAKNISILSEWLWNKFRIKYTIISGEKEAFFNGLANINEFPEFDEIVLFDVGGGSTEFTDILNGKIKSCGTIFLGVRRLHNEFQDDFREMTDLIKEILEDFDITDHYNPTLIGIGGTVTNLSAVKNNLKEYDSNIVHKSMLTKNDLNNLQNTFSKMKIDEISKFMPFEPKRAEIISTGIIIIKEIVDYYKADKFYVSDRGFQFGVLAQSEEKLEKML